MLSLSPPRPAEPEAATAPAPTAGRPPRQASMRDRLADALERTDWNITRAAKELRVTRNTVRARIRRYGLQQGGADPVAAPPPFAPAPSPPPERPVRLPASTRTSAVAWEQRRITFLTAHLHAADGEVTPMAAGVLDQLIDKVQSFGGRLEELDPRNLVATFGAEPVEDAPRRAAAAALAMLKSLEPGEHVGPDGRRRLGIAIHVSEVTAASVNGDVKISTDEKSAVSALIRPVLEAGDDAGIVVTAAAHPFLERYLDLVPLGPEPVAMYRLTGSDRAPFQAARPASPFVGRQHELLFLQSLMAVARQGRGQIVGIAGPAGLGKSRLVAEFGESLPDPTRRIETRCLSYATAIPYFAAVDLVRGLCDVADADPASAVADKVRAALEAAGVGPERSADLLPVLGIPGTVDDLADVAPETVRARTFETVRQLLAARSAETPIVLFVEDLHWIDRTSEELLGELAELVRGGPILAVFTYRPDYRPEWLHRSNATQIALQPLPAADARTVVRAAAGRELPDALVEAIVGRADGNPFFLEELARALRDDGAGPEAVPAAVEDVLRGRLARLAPEAREVVEAAAVIGSEVPATLLQGVVELPEELFRRTTSALERTDFLHEAIGRPPARGGRRFVFTHALTRDVAYDSIAEPHRRALHRRVVAALEGEDPARVVDQVDRLADHAFLGGMWDVAVTALRRAGVRASLRSANVEARARFERALEALAHLPSSRANQLRGIQLRFDLRNALFVLADFPRALEILREIASLAGGLEELEPVARASAYMANAHFMLGDLERGLELGRRARAIAEQLGDAGLLAVTTCALGQLAYARGDHAGSEAWMAESLRALDDAAVRARPLFSRVYATIAHCFQAQALAATGDFEAAAARGQRCLELAGGGSPFIEALAAWAMGHVALAQGRLAPAIAHLEHAASRGTTGDLRALRPWFAADLGLAYLATSRAAEAAAVLEEAVAEASSLSLLTQQSLRLARLAETHLQAGRHRQAAEHAVQAVAAAAARDEQGFRAQALRTQARVAAAGGEDGSAVARLEDARAAAAALGMRPLVARCHADLAVLHERGGDAAAARHHRGAADDLARALAIDPWSG
jgi:tetratricopeptide (TPR) repeat protein